MAKPAAPEQRLRSDDRVSPERSGLRWWHPLSRRFFSREKGAITVDWVVLSSVVVAVGLAALFVVSGGLGPASRELSEDLAAQDIDLGARVGTSSSAQLDPVPADPSEIILARTWTGYNSGQAALNHYHRLVDNRTDQQVRNGHRRWSRIANNPNHNRHADAADRVTVFEMALDTRGLTPHDGY